MSLNLALNIEKNEVNYRYIYFKEFGEPNPNITLVRVNVGKLFNYKEAIESFDNFAKDNGFKVRTYTFCMTQSYKNDKDSGPFVIGNEPYYDEEYSEEETDLPVFVEVENTNFISTNIHRYYTLLQSGYHCLIGIELRQSAIYFSFLDNYFVEAKHEKIENLKNKVLQHFCKFDIRENKVRTSFKMITTTSAGFSTTVLEYDGVKYRSFDLSKTYNDDFLKVSDKIVSHLNRPKSSGITILHGIPGTGKTTYLRYLISNTKKELIYLPPNMAGMLSDPSIIEFMRSNSNTIFIIEDGEEVLRKRGENGNTTAVSNLLNVADGILADTLHFNVIITINCQIDEIDPALRRKGRLVAEYKFDKLSADKSAALLCELYGEDNIPDEIKPMTLAEIYTYKEDHFLTQNKKNGIGFTANVE